MSSPEAGRDGDDDNNNNNNNTNGGPLPYLKLSNGTILHRGQGLEEYCQDHGLCPKCCSTKTHRRVLKLFGKGNKWEPITSHSPDTGEYIVYQGYCLKTTCFSVEEAKKMLGVIKRQATGAGAGGGGGRRGGRRSSRKSNNRPSSSSSSSSVGGANMQRPSRRKTRTNPDTDSVVSGVPPHDDDISIASDMSGLSQVSGVSNVSGMSMLSGISGISFGGIGRRGRNSHRRSPRHRPSSLSSSLSDDSSVMSGVSDMSGVSGGSFDDDDDMTVDSAMTGMSGYSVGMIQAKKEPVVEGQVSPVVQHRVSQLVQFDYFVQLDLTKVELRLVDLDALSQALIQTKTLEAIILESCKLKDDGIEKIAGGLEQASSAMSQHQLKKLSLAKNKIGNRGVQSLDFLFRTSATLEELNLSGNTIGSKGVSSIFSAFMDNPQTKLTVLDLSKNEIWELEEERHGFLKKNTTLKELNLDGNFLHDGGVEQICRAIGINKKAVIQKLLVGWNGIGDDGATALAKMMERNSTLQVLGLAENDITNTGARAILSALSLNSSIREISGLYHNHIDRKFIIVAIKRLLSRPYDRVQGEQDQGPFEAVRQTKSASDPKKDRLNESKVPEDDDASSDGSVNWANRLYDPPDDQPTVYQSPIKSASLALEAIEAWDWGTFGIEEIEEASKDQDDGLQMADIDDTEVAEDDELLPSLSKDRVVVFNAAPLASFSRQKQEHESIPLIDFTFDTSCLKEAFAEQEIGAKLELVFENGTADQFRSFFVDKVGTVLQLTTYGIESDDGIALENGFGYLQTISKQELKKLVNGSSIKVVVLNSCYPAKMARIFLDAGVPHVVSVQREKSFRDEGSAHFIASFYKNLAKTMTLKEAFLASLMSLHESATLVNVVEERYQLLPTQTNHDVRPLFTNKTFAPHVTVVDKLESSPFPQLPETFVGRSLDLYETLELLRTEDVIRVGGIGKVTFLSALSHYIADRPRSFQSSVFWLPPPANVIPQEDSTYGDLCQVTALMTEAEDDDIWDDDGFMEIRERIMLELEEKRTILIIDSRQFVNEASSELLERFLTSLLNEVSVKIILITATDSSRSKSRLSRSEETSIHLDPLGFKSCSLLFGKTCPLIAQRNLPMVRSPEEFYSYLVPPSMTRKAQDVHSSKEIQSSRERELYERIGKGNPREIVKAALSCTVNDMHYIIRLAKRPEVFVTSSTQLTAEEKKLSALKEKAIAQKNYHFAIDIEPSLDELEGLREKYPTIEQLMEKETNYKKKFSVLLKAKRYDDANLIKRKILAIKRSIMKERQTQNAVPRQMAPTPLEQLQERLRQMKANQGTVKMEDQTALQNTANASFFIGSSTSTTDTAGCILKISVGSVIYDFECNDGASGIVCWTNEAIDLHNHDLGKALLTMGGSSLEETISSIDVLAETEWGMAKGRRGEAIDLPGEYGISPPRNIWLAISHDDIDLGSEDDEEDVRHYHLSDLRSALRQCFLYIRSKGVENVGIPAPSSPAHRSSLDLVLETVVAESKHSDLKMVHLFSSSPEETKHWINKCLRLGLPSV